MPKYEVARVPCRDFSRYRAGESLVIRTPNPLFGERYSFQAGSYVFEGVCISAKPDQMLLTVTKSIYSPTKKK